MQFLTFLSVAVMAVTTVSAAALTPQSEETQVLQKRYDFRQLMKYSSGGGDGNAACRTFKCSCINYVPKNDCELALRTQTELVDKGRSAHPSSASSRQLSTLSAQCRFRVVLLFWICSS